MKNNNIIPSQIFKIVAVAIVIRNTARLDINLAIRMQQVVPASAVSPNNT